MSPVQFWDRSVDQAPAPATTSGVRLTFDPQSPPEDHNAERDELLTGEDIYSGDWPEPVRHPSQHLLDLAASSAGASGVTPSSPPVTSEAAPSQQQPGRGRDWAA